MLLQVDTDRAGQGLPLVKSLTGPRGLVTAVIWRALLDLTDPDPAVREDAINYFAGPVYRNDLQILDLNEDLLPIGISRMNH